MSNGSGGMHRVGRWHKVKLPQLGPPTCLQIHRLFYTVSLIKVASIQVTLSLTFYIQHLEARIKEAQELETYPNGLCN
jgi:hypothetical protein